MLLIHQNKIKIATFQEELILLPAQNIVHYTGKSAQVAAGQLRDKNSNYEDLFRARSLSNRHA